MAGKQVFITLVFAICLPPLTHPQSRSNQLQSSNSLSGRAKCPQLRFRRRGCKSRYECENVCEEKVKCKTRYEYKCTDYKKQKCTNKWQNQCNGKGKRSVRSVKSKRRPFWLNTQVVFDPADSPVGSSDVPLASPSRGQIFEFASPPRSRRCWQKVKDCKFVKYKSTCGNKPVKTCEDKPTTQCKRKCKNVYYCDKCPTSVKPVKPTPTTTQRPTRPTKKPKPTRPPVGPPAIPKPGSFIISPPSPPNKFDVIIDVKRRDIKKKRRP